VLRRLKKKKLTRQKKSGCWNIEEDKEIKK
jgi:hypothetical protein